MKKLLALVLALVMTLGLATVGANAALKDFSDAGSIGDDYNEAFAILNAVGVFQGSNGKLNPTGNLTRAEAAKLIAYLDLGETVAETLPEVEVFPDVPASHWASKYVAYCQQAGIIQGANGKYLPDDPLSGYAFGVYLLAVLGYDRNIEGMTGADWQVKTAAKMNTAGIGTDVEKAGSATLTRQEAAQYALDALKADVVEYQNKGTKVTMADGSSIYVGASAATPITTALNNVIRGAIGTATGTDYNGNVGRKLQLGEKLYKGSLKVTESVVDGRTGETWEYKNEEVVAFEKIDEVLLTYKKTISSSTGANATTAGTASNTAFVNAITRGNSDYLGVQLEVGDGVATDAYGNTPTANQYRVNYYINGVLATRPTDYSIANYTISGPVQTALNTLGVVTEFIDTNDNGRADVVNIITKSVAVLTAAPSVTTKGGVDYVTIPAVGVGSVKTSKVFGYEDLAKDDVVLYVYMTQSGNWYLEKADKITGAVTGNNAAKGALVDGSYYKQSGLTNVTYAAGSITDTKTYDLWLDNGGNIVRSKAVSEGAGASAYAAVAQIAWVTPTGSTSGAIGASTTKYAEARLVFTDGTTDVAKIKDIDGWKIVEAGGTIAELDTSKTEDYYLATAFNTNWATTYGAGTPAGSAYGDTYTDTTAFTGAPAANTTTSKSFYATFMSANGTYEKANDTVVGRWLAIAGATDLDDIVIPGAFYTYEKNSDGSYSLYTTALSGDSYDALSGAAVTNNTVKYDGTNSGNSESVFIYRTSTSSNAYVFTVYTGIAKAPTTSAAVPAVIHGIVEKNGVAKYVYVDATGSASLTSGNEDVVYLISGTSTQVNGTTTYYNYDAVVNGVPQTIKVNASGYLAGFYQNGNTVDADGIYTLNGGTKTPETGVGVQSIDGNVLLLKTAMTAPGRNDFKYAAGTKAYVISVSDGVASVAETTVDALTLDANDLVHVDADSTGSTAEAVYVKKNNNISGVTKIGIATNATLGSDSLINGTAAVSAAVDGTTTITVESSSDITSTENPTAMPTGLYISAVTITGKGTAVSSVSTTAGTNAGDLMYTTGTGDKGSTVTVTITVTDNYSKAAEVFTYTIAVS